MRFELFQLRTEKTIANNERSYMTFVVPLRVFFPRYFKDFDKRPDCFLHEIANRGKRQDSKGTRNSPTIVSGRGTQ